jgi:hypothetical protein
VPATPSANPVAPKPSGSAMFAVLFEKCCFRSFYFYFLIVTHQKPNDKKSEKEEEQNKHKEKQK